ncbi:MAG: serine hydrolase [Chryseolinea sp.]
MISKVIPSIAFLLCLMSCQSRVSQLKESIEHELSSVPGTFAVAFEDLSNGEQFLINEHDNFHAASTMKTPVMIEVYKQASEKKFSLDDSITIKNEFKSIVDGSPYTLESTDDSEFDLYTRIGKKSTIYDLMYDMIIVSSNLATNIIIDLVDANNVMATMKELGANDIKVLRGVEDNKAFDIGMNNTTTAYDLMLLFSKLSKGEVVNKDASSAMIKILLEQKFDDIIPAKLPGDVKVAHKTGFIKGVHHDSGIIMLPDGRRYILVLLSKDLTDDVTGLNAMANVSKLIYDYVTPK